MFDHSKKMCCESHELLVAPEAMVHATKSTVDFCAAMQTTGHAGEQAPPQNRTSHEPVSPVMQWQSLDLSVVAAMDLNMPDLCTCTVLKGAAPYSQLLMPTCIRPALPHNSVQRGHVA